MTDMVKESNRIFNFFLTSVLLASLALVISALAQLANIPNICMVGDGCRQVAGSKFGTILGVPTAQWGLGWLVAACCCSALRKRVQFTGYAMQAIGATGIGVSVLLQGAAWWKLNTFCLWCTLAAMGIIGAASCLLAWSARETDVASKKSVWVTVIPALALIASLFLRPVRCQSLPEGAYDILANRSRGVPTERTVFVFTDFGCHACEIQLPKILSLAKQRGLSVVVLPVTVVPMNGSNLTAMYFYSAQRRNYERQFIERFPGIGALQDFNRVAEIELKPSQNEILENRKLVVENSELFKQIGAVGTPASYSITSGRICKYDFHSKHNSSASR